jgi:hypothetical protein
MTRYTPGPGDESPPEPEITSPCCDYGRVEACPTCETKRCWDCHAVDVRGCEPCDGCLLAWPDGEPLPSEGLAIQLADLCARQQRGVVYAVTSRPGGWAVVIVSHVSRRAS